MNNSEGSLIHSLTRNIILRMIPLNSSRKSGKVAVIQSTNPPEGFR